MTKVFLGGSRHISRLSAEVRQRLDRIVDRSLGVIVGDANGADKAVQKYLNEKSYRAVEIFCSGNKCRNNAGSWPVRSIPVDKRKGYGFYAAKDRAMADEASYGLMIWDGKSVGTLMNAFRLARQNKPVVIFVAPERQICELKDQDAWERFVATHAPSRERLLYERLLAEGSHDLTSPWQARLL